MPQNDVPILTVNITNLPALQQPISVTYGGAVVQAGAPEGAPLIFTAYPYLVTTALIGSNRGIGRGPHN